MRRLATHCLLTLVASIIGLSAVACEKKTSPAAETSASPQKSGRPTTSKARVPDAEVEAKVIEIIAKQAGVRMSEISPAIRLHKDLVMDDLDFVEMTMQLEHTFSLSIPDEDAKKLETVGQVAEYVRSHRTQ